MMMTMMMKYRINPVCSIVYSLSEAIQNEVQAKDKSHLKFEHSFKITIIVIAYCAIFYTSISDIVSIHMEHTKSDPVGEVRLDGERSELSCSITASLVIATLRAHLPASCAALQCAYAGKLNCRKLNNVHGRIAHHLHCIAMQQFQPENIRRDTRTHLGLHVLNFQLRDLTACVPV